MKKVLIIIGFCCLQLRVSAQSTEVQQLILNVEKLSQFKQILADMKKGYQIISNVYGTIKNLSEGNFSLHQTFLDGLMMVNPTVKKYHRIAEIGELQLRLLKNGKSALQSFSQQKSFNANELKYIEQVFSRLNKSSMENLDDLLTVLTAHQLRMNDQERLVAIDRIYQDMLDKSKFINAFIQEQTLLGIHRQRDLQNNQILQNSYGLSSIQP